mgnify:FL=1
MRPLEELCFLFTIYSFLGWLCESIFCSFLFKKLTNRGFLNGPFCPVYGIGGLLITSLLHPFTGYPPYIEIPLVFVAGTLLTTLLEYLTGWLLETLFHTTWWDYSHCRFNYKGRICLLNSILFGLLCLVAMLILQPILLHLLHLIPPFLRPWILLAIVLYFLIDTLFTLHTILSLNGKLQQIQQLLDEFRATGTPLKAAHAALSDYLNENPTVQNFRERFFKLEKTTPSQRRLLRAFPTMKPLRNTEPFLWLQQEWEKYKKGKKDSSK